VRVYVVEASGKGGMIHYDYHLCRALQRLGIDATLVTSTDYELRDLDHEFRVVELLHLWDPRESKGGPAVWRKVRRAIRGVQYVVEWLRLILYLRSERPDVVVFGEIRWGFERFFLQLLKAFGLKLADIVHDVRTYDTRRGSTSILQESQKHLALYNHIYGLFDVLFVHDRSNYDDFVALYEVPTDRVHEIPLGTNEIILEMTPSHTPAELAAELGVPEDKPVVLFFGTITKYKGLEDLLSALPVVLEKIDAHLVVAGFPAKDVDPDVLMQQAADLGIEDQITWYLDYVPNEQIVPLLKLSNVVVFPYRAITQSAVMQIAYACGSPVVATRVGGLPDVVEDGGSGLLVDPENPQALANAIVHIISDRETAERMGERARELSELRYSWLRVGEKVKSVLEKLL
jgi:glycosyltransferase involved in cell wall biosynthesis